MALDLVRGLGAIGLVSLTLLIGRRLPIRKPWSYATLIVTCLLLGTWGVFASGLVDGYNKNGEFGLIYSPPYSWSSVVRQIFGLSIGLFVATLGNFVVVLIASTAFGSSDDAPRCHRCGYCLFGLINQRCPECGEAIQKIGVVDEQHCNNIPKEERGQI